MFVIKLILGGGIMWASLTIAMLFIYIVVTTIGLTRYSAKRVIQWLIASRLSYIVVIVTQIVITFRTVDTHLISSLITDGLSIILGGLTELNYSNKQRNNLYSFNILMLITNVVALICITNINIK